MALFKDRRDVGKKLAEKLSAYADRPDVVLALNAPMDIFLVRKLGLPGHEELAIGAIASGGIRVLNEEIIRTLGVDRNVIDMVARQEQQELEHREQKYRGDRPPIDVTGKTVILVDDGLATGASMRAAVAGLRTQDPAWIVAAVPTAAPETCQAFESEVDEMICATTPQPFYGVSRWYEDFSQTTDLEVRLLLQEANRQTVQG